MKTIIHKADRVYPKGWTFFSALRLESHPSGGFPVCLFVAFSPRRRLSEPEADQEKETSLCVPVVSNERSEWGGEKSKQRALPISKEM